MSDAYITTKPFKLSFGDHLAFGLAAYYRGIFLTPWVMLWAGIVIGIPAWLYTSMPPKDIFVPIALAAWLATGLLVLMPAAGTWRNWKNYRTSPLIGGVHTFEIGDWGVAIVGKGYDSRLAWATFSHIKVTKLKIFLILQSGGAHIIPVMAFRSQDDCMAFVTLARKGVVHARHFIAPETDTQVQLSSPDITLRSKPFRQTFGIFALSWVYIYLDSLFKPFIWVVIAISECVVALVMRNAIMASDWYYSVPILIAVPALYMVVLLALPFIFIPVGWLKVRKFANAGTASTVALTPAYCISKSSNHYSELGWAELMGVKRRLGLLMICTRPGFAIVIPISAFDTRKDAATFYHQALAYFNAAKAAAKSPLDAKA